MLRVGRPVHYRRPTLADQLVNGEAGYVLSYEVFLGHGREPNAAVGERQAMNARGTDPVHDAQE